MTELNSNLAARLATLDQLVETILPNFISPIPSRETLRALFDAAGVPRFKSNHTAKRGGGLCYYQVSAIEKLFKSRTLPPVFSRKVNL